MLKTLFMVAALVLFATSGFVLYSVYGPARRAERAVKSLPEVAGFLREVPNGRVRFDHVDKETGNYSVQVYEALSDHLATFGWYKVDKKTLKVIEGSLLGDAVTVSIKSPKLAFQINPPKDWVEIDAESYGYLASFNSQVYKTGVGEDAYTYSAGVNIAQIGKTAENDLDSAVSRNKELIQKSGGSIVFLKDAAETVGGLKMHILEFVSSPTRAGLEYAAEELGKGNEDIDWHLTQKAHFIYYFFLYNGSLYAVSGSALDSHWSEFEPKITYSIKSFKLLK